MLLTCRIRLCALFPDWGLGLSVNLFGGFPGWTNPGVVNKHVRSGNSSQPRLSGAVGGDSTHSGFWVSRTCLGLSKQKIWLDQASEVARTVCPNPPRPAGLALCPVELDPWPGVTPCESLPGWLNVLQDLTRNPRGGPIDWLAFSNHPAQFASSCLVGGRRAWILCRWWSESQSMYSMRIVTVRPATKIPSNFACTVLMQNIVSLTFPKKWWLLSDLSDSAAFNWTKILQKFSASPSLCVVWSMEPKLGLFADGSSPVNTPVYWCRVLSTFHCNWCLLSDLSYCAVVALE